MANSLSNITKGPGTEMDPTSGETSVIQRTNYLIAIGIDNYANKVAFPSLGDSCKKDCEEIIKQLTTKYGFQLVKYLKDEEASILSIKATIKEFRFDTQKNNANSNLVIYYSGHGYPLKPNKDVTHACWVPQGCMNIDDEDELYNVNKDLLGDTGQYQFLDVNHFLVIADACFSGGAFNYSNLFNNTVGETGLSTENERSCWAFCSSRSDKVAVLQPGENSYFTNILLTQLKDNLKGELTIDQLKADIEFTILKDPNPQTPFCKRMGILNENTGQFVLRANENIVNAVKRQQLLPDKLRSLNYNKQRDKLGEFENGKTHLFTIISGTTEGGLKFLNKMVVCSSSLFPGRGQPYIPVEVAYSTTTGEEQVIELFNLALSTQLFEQQALLGHIRNKLKTGALSVEFKFGKKRWLTEDKKTLIGNTARFLQLIHEEGEELNPLFIFIIDPDATEYEKFVDDPFFKSSAKLIMPGIELVDKTILVNWYDSVTNDEFDQLFKKTIVTDIGSALSKSKILPGELIRQICTASGCNDLAIQLLDD